MKIHFRTNLDEAQRDVANLNSLPSVEVLKHYIPRVKEYIVFPFQKWDKDFNREGNFSFHLEVVAVRHNYFNSVVEVELHIPRISAQSIAQWEEWFRKFRHGKSW